MELSALSR
jgi:hypothetical protein